MAVNGNRRDATFREESALAKVARLRLKFSPYERRVKTNPGLTVIRDNIFSHGVVILI